MERRVVAVFDFDGTLTCRDTFLEFIRYVHGTRALWLGFLSNSLFVVGYMLQVYPNYKLKQRIFRHFFQGMSKRRFSELGSSFQLVINQFLRSSTLCALNRHIAEGHHVIVISASVHEWVAPWCFAHGIAHVLATEVETDVNGFLTGRLASQNCYGQEKVKRLLSIEPDRQSYSLVAYGDSRGDREMLVFADEGILVDK